MSKSSVYSRLNNIFKPTTNAANSIAKQPTIQTPIQSLNSTKIYQRYINRHIKSLLNEKDSQKLVEKFKSLSKFSYFRRKYTLYHLTIHRLSLAKQYPLIEDAIESQKSYITTSSDGFAARLICLYGKAGLFEHAHKLFDELPKREGKERFLSFNALLGAASNAGKYEKCHELFRELPSKLSIELSPECYNTVAHALCKLGLVDDAESLLDEMKEHGLKPDAIMFHTLLYGGREKGEFERVERIWERMITSGFVPDVACYNVKLQAIVSYGKQSEAEELLEEMIIKGVSTNTNTYNVLIEGSRKEDDLDGVRKWLSELNRRDYCKPNSVTFSSSVPFLCDKGDYRLAFELSQRMFMGKCSVDESLLQKVVDGLAKNEMIKEAEMLVGLGKANKYHPYDLVLPSQGTV